MWCFLFFLLPAFTSLTSARIIARQTREISDCEYRRKIQEPEWTKPICNPDGSYKIYQCDAYTRTTCWCVYENGQVIPGTMRAVHDPHQEKRDLADCRKARKKAPPAPPPEPAPSSIIDPRLGYHLAKYEAPQNPSGDSITRAIDFISGSRKLSGDLIAKAVDSASSPSIIGPPPCPVSCPIPCPFNCVPQSTSPTTILSGTIYVQQPPPPPAPPPPPPPVVSMVVTAIQRPQPSLCPSNCMNHCPPGCLPRQTQPPQQMVQIPNVNPLQIPATSCPPSCTSNCPPGCPAQPLQMAQMQMPIPYRQCPNPCPQLSCPPGCNPTRPMQISIPQPMFQFLPQSLSQSTQSLHQCPNPCPSSQCPPGCNPTGPVQTQIVSPAPQFMPRSMSQPSQPCPNPCPQLTCPPGCNPTGTSPKYQMPQQVNTPFTMPQTYQASPPSRPSLNAPVSMNNPSQVGSSINQPGSGTQRYQQYTKDQTSYQNPNQYSNQEGTFNEYIQSYGQDNTRYQQGYLGQQAPDKEQGFYGSYYNNYQKLLKNQRLRRRKKVKKT